jgi:hypothetical protein
MKGYWNSLKFTASVLAALLMIADDNMIKGHSSH